MQFTDSNLPLQIISLFHRYIHSINPSFKGLVERTLMLSNFKEDIEGHPSLAIKTYSCETCKFHFYYTDIIFWGDTKTQIYNRLKHLSVN